MWFIYYILVTATITCLITYFGEGNRKAVNEMVENDEYGILVLTITALLLLMPLFLFVGLITDLSKNKDIPKI